MTVDLCMAYVPMLLVSVTLTLMQGHSGSAKANKSAMNLGKEISVEFREKKSALNYLDN